MYGYKVKIGSLPVPVWACETTVSDYMWWNPKRKKNRLEVSFSKFDTQTVILNENEYVLKNNSLACIIADEKRTCFCESGQPVTIITVSVRLTDFEYQFCDLTPADCDDSSILILPAFCEDLTLADELEITKTAYKCIKQVPVNTENKQLAFASAFFELLYKVDLIARKYISDTHKQEDHYIKKIDYLIESKYHDKLTLHAIAKELNVSQVYLSMLYKAHTGINFSEQLLNVRMKHAEKLLIDQNIPTSKVASLCGFCDENYFRKKFKQFFGVNVGEYRKYKNGLTLYHEKPTLRKKQE